MSLDNPNTVDAIGVEKTTGIAILTMTDAWDWSDEYQHLLALQDKLNAYLNFIESGEIFQKYPKARGREIIIDIVTKFPLPEIGVQFLEKANAACADLNVKVRNTYYPGSHNPEFEDFPTTWPFNDPPNVAVFTSKNILNQNDWIHTVTHDENDGAWQFHPQTGTDESEAKVVSLKTITQIDPSVLSLADLPLGWCAWRDTKEGLWKRDRMQPED